MLVRMFRKAGATGHVFLVKGGKAKSKGLAYSGLVGPYTTVAVVPTVVQILNFETECRTLDNQEVSVSGTVNVRLDPGVAMHHFDFTVNPKDGSYISAWSQELHALVVEQAQAPVRRKVRDLLVAGAINAHPEIADALKAALTESGSRLAQKGVVFDSSSIEAIAATDDEVAESIGSKERQVMLAEADAATHDRQMKASRNARAVKKYDMQTNLEVESARTALVAKQGENAVELAKKEAEATQIRLAPFGEIDSGRGLIAVLMKMGEKGIGHLSVGPELLAALQTK